MNYQFQFGPVFADIDLLLGGMVTTIWLTGASIVMGTLLGVVFAAGRVRGGVISWPIAWYVEAIRNTPFLVQLYLLYFSLPAIGIRLQPLEVALLTMTINLAAYSTEIIRSGIESIHRSQIEAGMALALNRYQIFVHVIIMPALKKVYPALASQYTLVMLMSSLCSAISTNELTAVANNSASASFRYFETYIVLTLLYLAMAIGFRLVCAGIGEFLFGRRRSLPTAGRMAVNPGTGQ